MDDFISIQINDAIRIVFSRVSRAISLSVTTNRQRSSSTSTFCEQLLLLSFPNREYGRLKIIALMIVECPVTNGSNLNVMQQMKNLSRCSSTEKYCCRYFLQVYPAGVSLMWGWLLHVLLCPQCEHSCFTAINVPFW